LEFRFWSNILIFLWFFSHSFVKLRRTAKRPTVLSSLLQMLSIPITKTDCFEQLAINAIGPRHVKEHLFFDPFSHFLHGGSSVIFRIQILVKNTHFLVIF